jgi:hypothetical protein
MTKPSTSLSALLEGFESEINTADGRIARLCRDANGNYWVIDGVERVVSLNEFAADCGIRARQLCERERAKVFRDFAVSVKRTFARIATAFRPGTPTVHA